MGFLRRLLLLASENPKLAEKLPRHPLLRSAVARFMPGEELQDALAAAEKLSSEGIASVVTLLGENVTEEEEAVRLTHHYRVVLETVKKRSLDCHISVKLTQLGLAIDPDICSSSLLSLVAQANELENFVWIDMEESGYVDATLDLYRRALSNYTNVGLCLQSYLYRTARDLETLLPLGPAIRLVKGAYAEPPHVAYRHKKEVDENFLVLAMPLLRGVRENGVNGAFATHDPKLIQRVQEEANVRGIPRDSLEFQMMYGIRPEDQLGLAKEGYRVRVLISYGSAWFPWYMRRLAERPANLFFVLRNVLRFSYS